MERNYEAPFQTKVKEIGHWLAYRKTGFTLVLEYNFVYLFKYESGYELTFPTRVFLFLGGK